jgi:uncharacterized membrane protein YebE (DUF533 family)
MNVQNLFNQIVGGNAAESGPSQTSGLNLGGLAGGAAAGSVMALLVGNKKARKFAGKAATVGGAAVLGGLAFSALRNWQQSKQVKASQVATNSVSATSRSATLNVERQRHLNDHFELTLVKTMISAANADGHIDELEQSRISAALEEMQVSEDVKAMVVDLIRYPESPEILARDAKSLEQATEIYLMACFTIDIDSPEERTFLTRLANALKLPSGLPRELEYQADELAQNAA